MPNALTIGTRHGSSATAHVLATKLNRHTFWCGQSGSGKTYALGVLLEQLILESGVKKYHHHIVGDLTLSFNGLDLVGHPAIQLTVLTAEPGSETHQALHLLGTWWKTQSQTVPASL
ncbi:hypothetical protein [Microbacterium sp. zg-YB36]|uniref:MmyB family transcriptional regulator n=1 Tax=Microbacterium sp. zg-YB36 TaxID=2969407 RepID=UPI00214B11B6|nr:hypothetical protein [Microbacterium sp. zg-YB36]MDL5351427.1 hypothetical protein [Microbacterium sp. zg-YB36]